MSDKNNCPKVSIITCVYNGEKYISKLLESVLNMGYPSIEHIIVNDGSTDSTEDIVMKYAELYKNKDKSNLYIKYIKQSNMGLGGATNTGLKNITGEYWTWINCDDWYEPEAFYEPIDMLTKKPKLDYVQMNGYLNSQSKREKERLYSKAYRWFGNRHRLLIYFLLGKYNKYLLYVCKTISFKKINPDCQIPPYRGTQDVQLAAQLFSMLNGAVCKRCCWNFLKRDNSLWSKINDDFYDIETLLIIDSIRLLSIHDTYKTNFINIRLEDKMLEKYKFCCKNHKKKESWSIYKALMENRKGIKSRYRFYLNHLLFLYLMYSFLAPDNALKKGC